MMDKAERDDDDLSVVSSSSLWNGAVQSAIRLVRPATPKLVPLLICLSTMPILFVLSLAAGWTVYSGVAIGWKSPLYLQYGDGRPPYAHTRLPDLSPNTPYDLSLVLTVPANVHNVALGNFMATLHLTNAKNSTIARVRRSSIVLEPSPMFILFGRPQRLAEISVPLLTSFVPTVSAASAVVELGRTDGWRSIGSGEGRELSIYSACIRGEVRPRGLRYLLSRFPISSAVAASASFFFLSMLALIACLVPVARWSLPEQIGDGGSPPREPSPAPARRASRRRRSHSLSAIRDVPNIKDEPDISSDSSTSYPSPSPKQERSH